MEKDHAFLEQADIDSLIRRLNVLNRCADLMEEIKSKVSKGSLGIPGNDCRALACLHCDVRAPPPRGHLTP